MFFEAAQIYIALPIFALPMTQFPFHTLTLPSQFSLTPLVPTAEGSPLLSGGREAGLALWEVRTSSLSRALPLPCPEKGDLAPQGSAELPYIGLLPSLITVLPQLFLTFTYGPPAKAGS